MLTSKAIRSAALMVSVFLAQGPAGGQSRGAAIQNLIDTKAALIQQVNTASHPPDIRGRALTKATRLAGKDHALGHTSALSAPRFAVTEDGDSLRRIKAPTYKLANGVLLQFTGVFRPDSPTLCVAYCS